MTNLTESYAQWSPALPPSWSMHLLIRLNTWDEGWQSSSLAAILTLRPQMSVCVTDYETHVIKSLLLNTPSPDVYFSSETVYSIVFLAQREPIIRTVFISAGFSPSHFPSFFLFLHIVFYWYLQSFEIILHWAVSVIELSSLCFSFTFHWHVAIFLCAFTNVCVDVCGCVSVSAENLEKSLRQMERQLLQLERDLETFSSPDDPNDMFFTKMAISFTHTCTHLSVESIIQGSYCNNLNRASIIWILP